MVFILGSGYLKKKEDAKIGAVELKLQQKYGDRSFIIDSMRRARRLAIMGSIPLNILAAFYAINLDKNPGLCSWLIALLLIMPTWFIFFRYANYITVVTPDYIENIFTSFRDKTNRISWNEVEKVDMQWSSNLAQMSVEKKNGAVMNVHIRIPNDRFRDIIYTIIDHVPVSKLCPTIRQYRSERISNEGGIGPK